MGLAFEAIAINVHISRKVMLYFPLRKTLQHFAVPVATEGRLSGEVACCDGSRFYQLARKEFTSHSMFPELHAMTAVLSDRLKSDLPIHAGHIPNRLNATPWSYRAT